MQEEGDEEDEEDEGDEGEADACAASASRRLQATVLDNHRGAQGIVSGDGMGREHSGPCRAKRIASGRFDAAESSRPASISKGMPPHLPSSERDF